MKVYHGKVNTKSQSLVIISLIGLSGQNTTQWNKLVKMMTLVWRVRKSWRKRLTMPISRTNATNATLSLLGQVIWGGIWKRTAEKNQMNATNVTMHPLMQALWRDIWKCTLEKSQTNAANVILHLLMKAIWGGIWKHTVEKNKRIQSKK